LRLQGDDAAKLFVQETILAQLKTIDMDQALAFDNPKQALKAYLNAKPVYRCGYS
jgi:hypothetical protein